MAPSETSSKICSFKLFDEDFIQFRKQKSDKKCVKSEIMLAFLLTRKDYKASIEDAYYILKCNDHKYDRSHDKSGFKKKRQDIGVYADQIKNGLLELEIFKDCSKANLLHTGEGGVYLAKEYFSSDYDRYLEIQELVTNENETRRIISTSHADDFESYFNEIENLEFISGWKFPWCEHVRNEIRNTKLKLIRFIIEFCNLDDSKSLIWKRKLYDLDNSRTHALEYAKILRKTRRYSDALNFLLSLLDNMENDEEMKTLLDDVRSDLSQEKSTDPNRFYINTVLPEQEEEIESQIRDIQVVAAEIIKKEKSRYDENVRLGKNIFFPRLFLNINDLSSDLMKPSGIEVRANKLMSLVRWMMTYWLMEGHWDEARKCAANVILKSPCIPATMDKVTLLIELGSMAASMNEFTEAISYFYQAYGVSIEIKDERLRAKAGAYVRVAISVVYLHSKNPDIEHAKYHLDTARNILVEHGGRHELVWTLHGLGKIYKRLGRLTDAVEILEECISLVDHERSDLRGIANAYQLLAEVQMDQRNLSDAYQNLCAGLEIFERIGDNGGIASIMDGLLNHARCKEDWHRAAIILGAVKKWREQFNLPGWHNWREFIDDVLAETSEKLTSPKVLESCMSTFSEFPEDFKAFKQYIINNN